MPHRSLGLTAAAAATLLVAACGATNDAAVAPPSAGTATPSPSASSSTPAPPSSSPTAVAAPPCELLETSGGVPPRIACVHVANSAQVFTGPNTLGPATYSLSSTDVSGCPPQVPLPYPAALGGGGINAQYVACPKNSWQSGFYWDNIFATASYAPPTPLPSGDLVTVSAHNPRESGSNTAQCTSSIYTQCTVDSVQQGGSAHYEFSIRNFPVTVAIENDLPKGSSSSLDVAQQPSYGTFVPDPNAGSARTIADGGDVSFFGMYGAVPAAASQQAPSAGTATQGFSASYQVPSSSTSQYAGTSILINAVLNIATGQLDKAQGSCQVSPGPNATNAPFCNIYLVGTPGAPQTIFVEIHP